MVWWSGCNFRPTLTYKEIMACENYFFSGCPCDTHPDFAHESSLVGDSQASLNLSCKLPSSGGSGGFSSSGGSGGSGSSLPHIGTASDFVYFPFESFSVEIGVFFAVVAASFAFRNFM